MRKRKVGEVEGEVVVMSVELEDLWRVVRRVWV